MVRGVAVQVNRWELLWGRSVLDHALTDMQGSDYKGVYRNKSKNLGNAPAASHWAPVSSRAVPVNLNN